MHKVKFKNEPIWLKSSHVGKYDGINFRLAFKEYTHPDADEVIQSFSFKWPGRIPEDKDFAEEGIKALFKSRRNALGFSFKVNKDEEALEEYNAEAQSFDEFAQTIGDDDII